MSVKKFEALVEDMIHKSPIAPQHYNMAQKIGALFKMVYSEVIAQKNQPKLVFEPKRFFSRIAGKNFGKRQRPKTSRF